MSIEANKAVIRRYKEGILNSRDLAALDAIVTEDYLDHAAFPEQGPWTGRTEAAGRLPVRRV